MVFIVVGVLSIFLPVLSGDFVWDVYDVRVIFYGGCYFGNYCVLYEFDGKLGMCKFNSLCEMNVWLGR